MPGKFDERVGKHVVMSVQPPVRSLESRRMQHLEKYVGRIVSLNKEAFQKLVLQARQRGDSLENCFLVAAVSWEMQRLVCYGASMRVFAKATEIALI